MIRSNLTRKGSSGSQSEETVIVKEVQWQEYKVDAHVSASADRKLTEEGTRL